MSKNPRVPITKAWEIANNISQVLREHDVKHEICGSLKRGNKTDAGDIDIAVSNLDKVRNCFGITNGGSKQASTTINGMTVGFYQTDPKSWGAMTLFLTGNGTFNIKMRIFAKCHGMKLNQYGLWHGNGNLMAAETEEVIFQKLGLQYKTPKEREFQDKDNMWKCKS